MKKSISIFLNIRADLELFTTKHTLKILTQS